MDTAYYFLDPQTFKLYPRAEVPQLSTPEHLASEAKNPPPKAPACPVNSHPPEAPKLHTPQVAHLISGLHALAHSIHDKPAPHDPSTFQTHTHYTFYNLPRPLLAHYHAYNNLQQLLVLTKH